VIRRACLAALLIVGRAALSDAQQVTVRDAGPGIVGRYLQTILAQASTRVVVADAYTLASDSAVGGDLVVIGRRADIAGRVDGDVVVVGGDLFIKPRALIRGEAIAIGGGAYGSLLGGAFRGLTSHRDFTYDAERTASGIELRYRETYVESSAGPVTLPFVYGLRLPSYDRSNGLSLPFGPMIEVGRAELSAVATYRSQLGRIDPAVDGHLYFHRKLWLEGFVGRESRSNEDWIDNRISNTMGALLGGHDERNWYRADAAWMSVNRMFETPTMTATYAVGGSFERASAVRPGLVPTGGPWSLMERTDPEGMFRPNPQIAGGDIASVTGSASYRWAAGVVRARLGVDLEVPVMVSTGEDFVQTVVDARVEFPTFGLQRYRFEMHSVLTAGEAAPGQRFAYLGGPGTIPTSDMLSAGGDQLLWLENRYEIPLSRIVLPMVGPPILTFRHIVGSAGVQALPSLTQVVGLRLSVPALRVQFLVDTKTRETQLSGGLALSR
jgi:hypothetical protein